MVLVPVGHLNERVTVFARLKTMGIHDLREHIAFKETFGRTARAVWATL